MMFAYQVPIRISRRCAGLLLAVALVTACTDEPVEPESPNSATPPKPRVLGFMEVTFDGIGTPDMTASVLTAPTLEALEERIAERERLREVGEDVGLEFTPPGGDGTLQLEVDLEETGNVDTNDARYIYARFDVRNAQSDGTPYPTERINLTLPAVSTNNTIRGTAIRHMWLSDNNEANQNIARRVMPSGLVREQDGELVSVQSDVIQVLTEEEVAAMPRTSPQIRSVFPYAFVVRNWASNTSRNLPANPVLDQFDGVLDMSYKLPLGSTPGEDPVRLSFMHMVLDDSETRLTQSLQEQNPPAETELAERADDLTGEYVTLLPGGRLPGWDGDTRTVCSVRTAGPPTSPQAYLLNADWTGASFSPDPYATDGSGSHMAPTVQIEAALTSTVYGITPQSFTVRGLQSGPAFRDATYAGNGSNTITTPQANFFPGEEVEIALVGPCPQPHVARYRVAASAGAGDFAPDSSYDAGISPSDLATGDLNGDGLLDLVAANFSSGSVSIFTGVGSAKFQTEQPISTGGPAAGVALADLDGDDVLDLVATVRHSTVAVFKGNGDGSFQPFQQYTAGDVVTSLAIGDFSGNGILDLAVGNWDTHNVSIFLGTGDGTFRDAQNYAVGDVPRDLAIGDVNGDGILDVVAAIDLPPPGGTLTVLIGSGDGTFTPSPGQQGLTRQGPYALKLADVSGNGILDAVVGHRNQNVIRVLLGDGNGGFGNAQDYPQGGSWGDALAIANLRGQGILDIVVFNREDDNIAILENDGSGSFGTAVADSIPLGGAPGGGVVADLAGTGVLQIAVPILSLNRMDVLTR